MAESLRRATHRLGATRVPKPYRRSRRAASATHPDRVLRVLPPGPHTPLARQGCTRRPANRAAGARDDHPDSRGRWSASSLRSAGGVVQLPTGRASLRTLLCSLLHSASLRCSPEKLIPPRPTAGGWRQRPLLLPAPRVFGLLRRPRMFSRRAERSFGEGQVAARHEFEGIVRV